MIPDDESTVRGTAPQPAGDGEADNEGASQTVPPPQPRKPRTLQNVVVIVLALILLAAVAITAFGHHLHK